MIKYQKLHAKVLFVVLLTSILLSCSNYKELTKIPEINSENYTRDIAVNQEDTTSIADIQWREIFTDDKLQNLIEEGIKNNYDLKIAATRIKESEAELSMAQKAVLPSLSIAAEANDSRISSGSNGTRILGYNYTGNQNTLDFISSWEIDVWGKLSNQTKAQYASYLQSIEYKRYTQTSLVATIAKNYYNLLTLDEQLRITKETIDLLEKSTETIKALKDAGQETQAAVEQSYSLLYNTKLSVYDLENEIYQQENAICTLIGRKSGNIARNTIQNQRALECIKNEIPVKALANRPDVKQQELALQAAYANVNVAKASFYPSISINSLALGYGSSSFTNFFNPANIAANIIGEIAQPIFNKGKLKGNLKLVQAQQEEALLTFSNTVLSAGQEISNILYGYNSSMKKNEWRDKQIESLTKAVDYTQDLLKAGEANYYEVLTAEKDLLSARLSQVSDKMEQITYNINFYKAMGGGTK